MDTGLPIYKLRNEIQQALHKSNQLIIHAPTGSGKSTLVPQFLIEDVLSTNESVIVLQPRRMAARLLASFIARDRNVELGSEVGYQVRMEGKYQPDTRILFLTEGILMNRMLSNDTLEHTSAIIFDEFHERHLETDLSLSLALQLQRTKRKDLKIIVMSATLEIERLENILTGSELLISEGRQFPVQIDYCKAKPNENIWDHAVNQLIASLPDFNEGSALVFMPGAFEIKKTVDAIQNREKLAHFNTFPLYGTLLGKDQDLAVLSPGRKIIVSTNVAETSLTIPGIRLVIDSGLARISRYDARRGINTLFVEPISRMSADQRAGRAGRTAPGKCIRLWSEFEQLNKAEHNTPEIHRIDLSEAVLGILAAGFENINEFPWIEIPGKTILENAFSLLHILGAIGADDKITMDGLKMAMLKVHPRYARLLLKAQEYGCLPAGAILVAISQSSGFISSSPDPVLKNERLNLFGNPNSDLISELNAWLWAGSKQFNTAACNQLGINAHVARQIGQLAVQILQRFPGLKPHENKLPGQIIDWETEENLRKCIMAGFVDFLAIRHKPGSPVCTMFHRKSGQLSRDSNVQNARTMVVSELEESKSPTGVQIVLKKVTAIEMDWLQKMGNLEYTKNVTCRFDPDSGRVVQISEFSFQDLVLNRLTEDIQDDDVAAHTLLHAIREGLISFSQWNDEVEHFVHRVNFAAKNAPQYQIPSINDEDRDFITLQTLYRCRTNKEIQRQDLWPHLHSWLSAPQHELLNLVAPEFISLPHRKRPVKLRYTENGEVILSETIQALYDCPLPVTVAEGKVPVIFELLAPSRRPVQITKDLAYFWENSYKEIKKELKGRYPKHEWR